MLLRWQLDLDNLAMKEIEEINPYTQLCHSMANTWRHNNTLSLPHFLLEHWGDPALKVLWSETIQLCVLTMVMIDRQTSYRSLKTIYYQGCLVCTMMLMSRCSLLSSTMMYICLINFDAIMELKILSINYTTYNIHWDHDIIQTTCSDVVMTSLRDDMHPFWYAQVLCTFNIQVHFCPGGLVI